jgi:hypothetical protein
VLWIGKDRTVASFEQFFNLIGQPLEPMKKVAKTLRGHRELILNYFRAKLDGLIA